MTIDPVLLEIIANRLEEIQRIMKHRLFHTGYSTILRESFDGGSGLTDWQGELIGASGVVTHTVPYSRMVRAVLEAYGTDDIHDGDAFISNDPYKGGVAHTPDLVCAAPVFVEGELIAFCTTLGHKPDLGGIAPGSVSAKSRSIFHEGLLIPPVKLYESGQQIGSVRRIIENNSRTPDLLFGDIQGQVGSVRIGTQLLTALVNQYGAETVKQAMAELMSSSEHRLRDAIVRLPDGEAEDENWLDSDNVTEDPIRVHVRLVKKWDSIHLDFGGSADQTAGPCNAIRHVVEAAACGAVLSFIDHTIPYNAGVFRPIEVSLPLGKVVNPTHPAPVNSYIPTTQLVFNAVISALGKLAPERAIADSGVGLGAVTFGYESTRTRESHVQYEICASALGGTARGDGASVIFPMIIFETVQPIEILETEFPVRIRRYNIRRDSAGPGKHRGGLGYIREYEVLGACHFISRLSQRKFGARGIAGGKAPPLAVVIYNPGEPNERLLAGLDEVHMSPGDIIRIEQSGGGGWGNPLARDNSAVLADVMDGYVSEQRAGDDYGFVIGRDCSGRYAILESSGGSSSRGRKDGS